VVSQRDAFLRAIIARPDDDVVRLVFADWLEEHGEPEFTEFIRVQCELEPIRRDYGNDRANELRRREDELRESGKLPVASLWKLLGKRERDASIGVRRGFPYCLSATASLFVECGARVRPAFPTLRRVSLFCVNGQAAQLAACEHLRCLPELELACWYTAEQAGHLAASPHLRDLETLVIWLGGASWQGSIDPPELVRLFAAAPAWPNLRELTLWDPDTGKASDRLVRLANKIAGRPLARVVRPRDGRLPFAPSFSYFCPGKLPNGRRLVAKPIGQSIHVIVFGKNDRVAREYSIPQTEEVRALMASEGGLYGADSALREAIHQAVGSVPAFIRVFPFHWPDDEDNPLDGPDYFFDDWAVLGRPDDPNPEAYREDPFGYGGVISGIVDLGKFGCGVGWCGEDGEVHST
jgi:uncharacterized protein (TIGR02996 family)